MFDGFNYNLPQVSYGYAIDIDGVGRLDYVSFMRSPPNLTTNNLYSYNTVFGYTVLGRERPVNVEELIKAEEEKTKRLAEEKRILEEEQAVQDREPRGARAPQSPVPGRPRAPRRRG